MIKTEKKSVMYEFNSLPIIAMILKSQGQDVSLEGKTVAAKWDYNNRYFGQATLTIFIEDITSKTM